MDAARRIGAWRGDFLSSADFVDVILLLGDHFDCWFHGQDAADHLGASRAGHHLPLLRRALAAPATSSSRSYIYMDTMLLNTVWWTRGIK